MTVFKVWGVKVKVNLLFLVVLFLFALVGDLARALTAFSIVTLHELGHIWVATRYGMKIKKIELLPFGGVAAYEGLLEANPKAELKVALAGPTVNLTLVLIATILTRYDYLPIDSALFFIACNLTIGLFNLVPALPLDGGRVLRSFLVPNQGFFQATHFTLLITRIFAILFGILAFIFWILGRSSLLSLLVAFFVYFTALKEEEQSIYLLYKYLNRKKSVLLDLQLLPGQQYMVLGDTLLANVLKGVHPRSFTYFLIYDRDYQYLGKLTEVEVLEAFFEQGENVPIRELL